MPDSRAHLLALLENRPTPDAVAWVRRGLRHWLLSGTRGGQDVDGTPLRARIPSLPRFLALPTSPERARMALRDAYLVELAEYLAETMGREPWALACELQRLAVDFEGRKWPCWWRLNEPPLHASEPERLLWHAKRMGGGADLPRTPQRYRQLLRAMGW